MKKLTLTVVAIAALAFPAIAAAKMLKHEGQITKRDGSVVKLKVERKGGEIVGVKNFKAKRVLLRCESGPKNFEFEVTGTIPVDDDNRFKERLSGNDNPEEKLRISGKVRKNGRVVVGNIKTNEIKRNGEDCRVPKQRFRTTKV